MNIYIPNQNDIIHETSVDFVLRPCAKEIHIVQYDKSLPIVKVELFKNGERYQLPDDAIVNVRLGKLDRTFVYKSILGTNEDRNVIYFEIDEQMTTIPGRIWPVIEVIYPSNKVANSSPIHFIIERNPIQNDYIESEDYFPIIYELQGTVADHETRISNLESQVGGEVVTLHTNQYNIDGEKMFTNLVFISSPGRLSLYFTPTASEHAVNKGYVDTAIENVEIRSDVIDVLGTYQDLQNYDTSDVRLNDLIKVISDETHDDAISYYRWENISDVNQWVYVASEGPFYTISQVDDELNKKVTANTAITGATKCKITYDSKGLVTDGADLDASDIPNLDTAKITSGTFADARIASASAWNAKYDKPSTGIPASDLEESYVTEQDVDKNVISKISLLNDQSQITGGTYPRLLKYNDNKLYLFLENRYRVSTDKGKTWSEETIIFTIETEKALHVDDIDDVGNAFPALLDDSGRIVVFYHCHSRANGYYSIVARVSDTNGENFTTRQTVVTSSSGLWEPFYYMGWLYYSLEHDGSGAGKAQSQYRRSIYLNSSGNFILGASKQFINGRNKVNMDGDVNPLTRIGMLSAAQLEDGYHIFVFESSVNNTASQPRPMVVQYLYVKDPTASITNPTTATTIFMGSVNKSCGAPFVTTLDDGRIVISFQTNENYTGYNRTDFRNCQFVAFVSKRKVRYNDSLTADDFVKLTTYEYGKNEYGVLGSVSNIDGILYKAFTIGKNTGSSGYSNYGNLVQKCLLEYNIPYVVSNAAITGATKCKITYDSKGLVTAGADLAASDIPDLSTNYVNRSTNQTIDGIKTFQQRINLNNHSGIYFYFGTNNSKLSTFGLYNVLKGSIAIDLSFEEGSTISKPFYVFDHTGLWPMVSNLDIGSSTYKWRDAYLTGSLKDGTNSITIAQIVAKQDALAIQTAYNAKGSATKVPQITTNSLGQVTGITEVDISFPATGVTSITAGTGLTTTSGSTTDGGTISSTGTLYLTKVLSSGATKCKVTYDVYGRVTAGADLAASDIPDLSTTYLSLTNAGTQVTYSLSGTTLTITTK